MSPSTRTPRRGRPSPVPSARLPIVVLSLLVLLPLPAACGDESGGSATNLEPVTDTVAGIERLTYPAPGATELAWGFDTTAVIGGYTEDDPDYQFGRLPPQWLASDAAGNLYVFDSDGVRILGYGPDGSLVGTWGREGGGPGEIGGRFIGALAMGPGDTLWIADRSNRRFTLIPTGVERDGPASVPFGESGAVMSIDGMAVDSAGAIAVVSSFVFEPAAEELPPQTLQRIARTTEPGASGESVAIDTLWTAPPRKVNFITMTSGNQRVILLNRQQFQPELSWARFSDGGLVVQDAPEYELYLLDRDGATKRIIRRDPPPRPTTETDRQAVIDETLAPPDNGQDDPAAADRRRQRADAMTFANVIPRIVEFRIDPKDRLWVGVSEQEPGEIERIDVFDRDGTLLGELRDLPLPHHFLGENRAVLLGADEFEVQQIRVLRLVDEREALETASTN